MRKYDTVLRLLGLVILFTMTMSVLAACQNAEQGPSSDNLTGPVAAPAEENDDWNPRPWTPEDEKAEQEKQESKTPVTDSEVIEKSLSDVVLEMDAAMTLLYQEREAESDITGAVTEVPIAIEGADIQTVIDTWGTPVAVNTQNDVAGASTVMWDIGYVTLPNIEGDHTQHCVLYVQYDRNDVVLKAWGEGEFDPEPVLPDTPGYSLVNPGDTIQPVFEEILDK